MKFRSWKDLEDSAWLSSEGPTEDPPEVPNDAMLVRVERCYDGVSSCLVHLTRSPSGKRPRLDFIEFEGTSWISGSALLQLVDLYWRLGPEGIWEDVPPPLGVCVGSLQFRHGDKMTLDLAGVSIRPGQLAGVMGPSGCGKSTFIRCLLGELTPESGGVVYVDEQEKRIGHPVLGYVPQENLLYPYLSVKESLAYVRKIRPQNGLEKPDVLLSRLRLENVSKTRVARISGGEAKRVNVAIELQQVPQVLILDEPTSGLDPRMQDELMNRLREIAHSGVTVVCVTHDLGLVRKLDHLIIIRALRDQPDYGSIVYQGPADQLTDEELFESYHPSCRWTMESHSDVSGIQPGPDEGQAQAPTPRMVPFLAVCSRSWKRLIRNPGHAAMSFLLPVALSFLILLSQLRQGGSKASGVVLFSSIALLWLAMNFGVREIVSERSLLLRDFRSGLSPFVYILSKSMFVAQVASIQVLLFLVSYDLFTAFQPGDLQLHEILDSREFLQQAILPLLFLGFTGGSAGLMVSSLCRSEALAVTLVPLILIPHLLFNRIAYHGENVFTEQAHLYGPAPKGFSLRAIREEDQEQSLDEFAIHTGGSALLFTRPALNVLMFAVKGAKTPILEVLIMFWMFVGQTGLTTFIFLKRYTGKGIPIRLERSPKHV